jgi:hypothetical protein
MMLVVFYFFFPHGLSIKIVRVFRRGAPWNASPGSDIASCRLLGKAEHPVTGIGMGITHEVIHQEFSPQLRELANCQASIRETC